MHETEAGEARASSGVKLSLQYWPTTHASAQAVDLSDMHTSTATYLSLKLMVDGDLVFALDLGTYHLLVVYAPFINITLSHSEICHVKFCF